MALWRDALSDCRSFNASPSAPPSLLAGARRRRGGLKVSLALGGVGDHGLGARLPASGAHLTMLCGQEGEEVAVERTPAPRTPGALTVGELERLHQPQALVNGAAHGQVVDLDAAHLASGIDDEGGSQRHARIRVGILNQHAKRARHGLAHIWGEWGGGTGVDSGGDKNVSPLPLSLAPRTPARTRDDRDFHGAQAALGARCVDPRQVRKLGVHRNGGHLATDGGELGHAVRECGDLSGAHERPIQRVPKQHAPCAPATPGQVLHHRGSVKRVHAHDPRNDSLVRVAKSPSTTASAFHAGACIADGEAKHQHVYRNSERVFRHVQQRTP